MISFPNFHRLSKLKNQIVSRIIDHKTLILVSGISLISLIAFGVFIVKVRAYLLYKIAIAQQTTQKATQQATQNDIYYATTEGYLNLNLASLSASDAGILGISHDIGDDETSSIDIPYPVITDAPLPVVTPKPIITTTNTFSPPSCAGTPTVDNSQVYVSTKTAPVGSTVSIEVDLQDCNNSIAPVSDSLTITLSSGDASTKINGSSSPVPIQTQNGKATFLVSSSNVTVATFTINDTTRSFTVTAPGYHNPSVTFTSSGSGSTGNPKCTTSAGAPNTWYSDVYPNPPITTTTGSVMLLVVIRDCFQYTTTVSDQLKISLASGDSNTKVDGNSLPYTLSAQNGEARFTVTSQINGTVTLVVSDITSGFTVTDPYNDQNPIITFSGSSTSMPTDTPTPTPGPPDTPTPTPGTVTPTLTPTDASTPGPSGATGP